MRILQAKQKLNPLHKYRVIYHFLCIEFQHCSSPHTNILLWLENVSKEPVSENMPLTTELINKLCSADSADLPEERMYSNQVQKCCLKL